jgi:thiol:disulfide interchange protein DsbC
MRTNLVPALLGVGCLVFGATSAAAENPAFAVIRANLEQRFPDVKVVDVKTTPMAGLYEVFSSDNIAYTDVNGDFLIVGSLLDTRTKQNITADSMDERNAIDFGSLPFARAIKTVKGSGQRQLAVFSDPDCPYCLKLEGELTKITDVTIYTFLYPLEDLHPGASAKALTIWCAKDRVQAWSTWMSAQRLLPPLQNCADSPVQELQALGEKLGISSTPTLFAADGRRVSGTMSAERIEELLNAATQRPVGKVAR